jgi:hypothetical protein
MYCYVMQPWVTIRGQSTGVTAVTQSENCWLDLTPFQDVVAWLECKEVTGGSGTVQMAYQTGPTKDESLFTPIVAAFNVATGVTTTTMLKDGTVTTPLCRWLRWQLAISGSPGAVWDATFRIFIAANVVGRGGRAKASPAMRAQRAPSVSGPAGVASSVPSTPLHLQSSVYTYGTAVPTTYGQRTQSLQASTSTNNSAPRNPTSSSH